MIRRLFDLLFGCSHLHSSNPITMRDPRTKLTCTRVVCLTCGAEFEYSLQLMRRGRRIERPVYRVDRVALERAIADGRQAEVIDFRERQLSVRLARWGRR